MKEIEFPALPAVDAPVRRLERASRLGRTLQVAALAAGIALVAIARAEPTLAAPLPAASRDAAILATLPPGAYSAVVRGTGAATGIGLVEIYLLP